MGVDCAQQPCSLSARSSSQGLVVFGGKSVLPSSLGPALAICPEGEGKPSVLRDCTLRDLWELPGAQWADRFPIPTMDPCQIWNFLFGFSPDVSLFKLCPEHSNQIFCTYQTLLLQNLCKLLWVSWFTTELHV